MHRMSGAHLKVYKGTFYLLPYRDVYYNNFVEKIYLYMYIYIYIRLLNLTHFNYLNLSIASVNKVYVISVYDSLLCR